MTDRDNSCAGSILGVFVEGCAEARVVIAEPALGAPEMVPTIITTAAMAGLGVALSPWIATAPVMVGAAIFGGVALVPIGVALLHPRKPLSAGLLHLQRLASELGRTWTFLRCGVPHMAMWRLRRPGRVEEDWPWVVANAWAMWLTVVVEMSLLWAGAA